MTQTIYGPLILGGSGRVGRALAAQWPKDSPALWQTREGGPFAWDILTAHAPNLPHGITGIIALAGTADPDRLADNAVLALIAADLGARTGLPVLLASSQAVYGRPDAPVSEIDPAQPDTPYGHAKRDMELAVAGLPHVTCLRIANVAGCDGLLINAASQDFVTLDRFPDGTGPRRAYIGPAQLGHVLRALIAHAGPLPQVLNVAQPGSVLMADVLDAAGVKWGWKTAGAGALPALDLNCAALTALTPVPDATAQGIVADARASGWGLFR